MPFTFDWTVVASQGLFAVLFVSLFVWTINRDSKREEFLRNEGVKREDILRGESNKREERLLGIIDCYNASLDKLAEKLGLDIDPIRHVHK